MTKHITLFDTTAEYNNASLDLPNVSYTLDDLKVHYNPNDGKLLCKYNVKIATNAIKLLNSSSNVSAIEVDGTPLNNVVTSYTFSTTGVHTVKYTLINNTSIVESMFDDCVNLVNVIVPDSVTSISDSAFFTSSLRNITIPNSITSIGEYSFSICNNLTDITIPNSVTSIGEGAFSSCNYLSNVIIGNSITSIGDYAFSDCGLNDLTLTIYATTPPTLGGSDVFYNSSHLNLVIKVPSASVNAYKTATRWSSYANNIQSI